MKSLAREGAQARLRQLETDANELLRAFPDLRDRTSSRVTSQEGSRRGRKQMTAAERRSVSVRMKRYWAKRRQKNGASKSGPGRPKGSEKRKGISAAGRAAIAAAQKKRWANIRKAKQIGGTDVRERLTTDVRRNTSTAILDCSRHLHRRLPWAKAGKISFRPTPRVEFDELPSTTREPSGRGSSLLSTPTSLNGPLLFKLATNRSAKTLGPSFCIV